MMAVFYTRKKKRQEKYRDNIDIFFSLCHINKNNVISLCLRATASLSTPSTYLAWQIVHHHQTKNHNAPKRFLKKAPPRFPFWMIFCQCHTAISAVFKCFVIITLTKQAGNFFVRHDNPFYWFVS